MSGASIAALEELGRKNGYTLVCSTGNAFFVRNDYVNKLKEYDKNLTTEKLYVSTQIVQEFLQKINQNQELISPSEFYFLTPEYNNIIYQEKTKIINEQNEQV